MMKEAKLRAIGYCRTSGEAQRDNTSIPNQRACIETFCQSNDWKFGQHYIDESKTGSKIEGRDAFQEMLKDAALQKFDLVVCYDVTRFARDGVDILGQAKFLRQAFGIHVVDTKGRFDSRPTGNALLNFVHAGVSEFERISIMERMIGARINCAKAGRPWSGKKPFGRDYSKENGWTVNERGLHLKALLERYVAGEGLTDLLKEFTEFSSPEIVLFAVRTSQLSGTYVKEFNVPDLNIKELKIPIPAIPQVITPELEAKVRSRMEHRRRWNKEGLRHYLLTGFVRCGHCGRGLSGNTLGDVSYYRHTYHHLYERPQCVFHSIREAELVPPVLDYLFTFFTDEPTFNAAVAAALPDKSERQAMEKERDAAQRNLAKVDKEISRLVDAITKGADPALLIGKQEELKAEKDRLTERLADCQGRLQAMPDPKVVQHEAMAIRLDLLREVQKRDWRKLSFDEIKRFLVFLFGENPGKTGSGIAVTREKGRWRISFKGQVSFYHDVLNGRAISHLVKAEADRHNQAFGKPHKVNEFMPASWKPRPFT